MHRTQRGLGSQLSTLNSQLSKGFTLIELLVVISIIAILSFTVITNLTSARTKARDAKRTSDISEIDKALQLFIVNNANQAAAITGITGTASARFGTLVGATGPLVANTYLPNTATVKDPLDPARSYEFKNTSTTAGVFDHYALCAQLENPASGSNWYVDVDGSTSLQANDNACQP